MVKGKLYYHQIMKLKKILKEIILFVIMITIVTNTISYFKSERLNLTLPNFFPQKTKIVYFYTKWCPVCKVQKAEITSLSNKVKVIKIDAQQKPELAKLFKVKGYPTIFYIKNKKVVWSDIGYTSRFSMLIKSWLFSYIF